MAEHGAVEVGTADGNDYIEHERTYEFFTGLVKWATFSVAVVLILMATFLL